MLNRCYLSIGTWYLVVDEWLASNHMSIHEHIEQIDLSTSIFFKAKVEHQDELLSTTDILSYTFNDPHKSGIWSHMFDCNVHKDHLNDI